MNRNILNSLVLCLTLGVFSLPESAWSGEDRMHQWQLSLLYNPSEQQLKVERRGRVMIYDGMHRAEIDRALGEQFDRIEHMMFVNTVVTDAQGKPVTDPETGELMVEADGCD